METSRTASDERSASLELASLLKTLRVQAGFSQQMLADRALVSVQAVSALERGYRKVPYPKTLERLADALALTPEARAALQGSARRARGLRLAEKRMSTRAQPAASAHLVLGPRRCGRGNCRLVSRRRW